PRTCIHYIWLLNPGPCIHYIWLLNPGPCIHYIWLLNPGPCIHYIWLLNPGPSIHYIWSPTVHKTLKCNYFSKYKLLNTFSYQQYIAVLGLLAGVFRLL
ncbi:unnamed protein product, partial [Staurois parvus]